MNTIGKATSRMRNIVKAVKEDPFLTDRTLYSLILKYAKLYIHREDNKNKILKMSSLFTRLPCTELVEVDRIEACCGIASGCTFMRTKNKLPDIIDGPWGPMFRSITSIDGSVELYVTEPGTYLSMTKTTTFKYNKSKYYWFLNGYLYFPNIEWEAVAIEALFIGDTECFVCDQKCLPRQEQAFYVPDFLFAEIEEMVKKDLGFGMQVPPDQSDDKQNSLR